MLLIIRVRPGEHPPQRPTLVVADAEAAGFAIDELMAALRSDRGAGKSPWSFVAGWKTPAQMCMSTALAISVQLGAALLGIAASLAIRNPIALI